MGSFQYDAYDKAAERFVPTLLAALKSSKLEDPVARKAAAALAEWNYVAEPEAIGPAIWLRWLENYRDAVWQNKWQGFGLEAKGGSWGFCGSNRREPVLELLEYLTREQPKSPWFDDRSTPAREDRDAIMVQSFGKAVASLQKQFGADLDKWRWKRINRLQIASLTGERLLARSGGPVPGTEFTVNPGSNIGTVGGGASWRMIVDFGNAATSVGVYPGGQSENPLSPHYADQMSLWAQGRYSPLHAVHKPEDLPRKPGFDGCS
jgi:penicillin amidase